MTDPRHSAYLALADAIERIGGTGVDGGAIAGLFVAGEVVRFDGTAYRITDGAYLDRTCILRAQAIVDAADLRMRGQP